MEMLHLNILSRLDHCNFYLMMTEANGRNIL